MRGREYYVWQQHKYMTCGGQCNFNDANSSVFQPLSEAYKMYIRLFQLCKQFHTEHLKGRWYRTSGSCIPYSSVSIGLFQSAWTVIRGYGNWRMRNYGWGLLRWFDAVQARGHQVWSETNGEQAENRRPQTLSRWGMFAYTLDDFSPTCCCITSFGVQFIRKTVRNLEGSNKDYGGKLCKHRWCQMCCKCCNAGFEKNPSVQSCACLFTHVQLHLQKLINPSCCRWHPPYFVHRNRSPNPI